MRAAVALRDVVGEGQDILVVAVIPPQRDLNRHVVALTPDQYGLGDERRFDAVEIAHESLKPALVEKLLALQRVGLLDFSVARHPRVLTDEASGCFELRCDEIPGAVKQFEIMVDARYPSTDILADVTPLYRNLQRRGIVRPYENRSRDDSAYSPGAIDMIEGSNFVVNDEGVSNEDISVIGIPTEGYLIGNKTIARGDYPGIWAAEVIRQLRCRERALPDRLSSDD